MNNINTVFWDWNGTLLNDMKICIDSINILLRERNKQKITPEIYRKIFTFPVKEYYKKAGFDFSEEDFSTPATQFINLYKKELYKAPLFENTLNILNYFHRKNIQQYIISAMEQKSLTKSVKERNISNFFNKITGINDHYAASKIDRAKQLIKENNIEANSTCLIGDTVHDYEVANKIGCKCILVANGHQNKERLISTKCKVVDKLEDVKGIFLGSS